MRSILCITRFTVIEQLRQRLIVVPLVGFVLSLIVLGTSLTLTNTSFEGHVSDAELIAWTLGMGAGVGATIYAIIIGASMIARDMSSGVMLMLAARPVGRWKIVLGRFLGAALFLTIALVLVAASYGLLTSLLARSFAPLDDSLLALLIAIPATYLGLAFGLALSVQGKATAAIGTAFALAVFSTVTGMYANEWLNEQHMRSYLTPSFKKEVPPPSPVIGTLAIGVTYAIPFPVFLIRTFNVSGEREGMGSSEDSITVMWDSDHSAPVPEASVTSLTGETTQGPSELPEAPVPDRKSAIECARYSGAGCLLNVEGAWIKPQIPQPPTIGSKLRFVFALLAIPAWLGVSILLLHRRRELTE